MEKQVKLVLMKVKKFFDSLTKKMKIILLGGLVVAILLAIFVPIALNSAYKASNPYAVLYPKITEDESLTIYNELTTLGIDATMNNKGETLVRKDLVETSRISLAALGYPKSGLSYDIFNNSSGFLTTELERQTILKQQAEARLEGTLQRINGVQGAIVSLALPENTSYVWQDNAADCTASVLLTMDLNKTLDYEQVAGAKFLVASAIPTLTVDNVKIIDAYTGVELTTEPKSTGVDGNIVQLEFTSAVEKKMNDKVRTLLAPTYGAENIAVSATVVLDFDKMVSDETIYTPQLNGKGVLDYIEEYYDVNGEIVQGGIVGEDGNTDEDPEIPIYPTVDDVTTNVESAKRIAKYLVNSINTKIEKNQADTLSQSVSVIIKGQKGQEDLSEETIDALNNSVAKALGVNNDSVLVNYFPDVSVVVPVVPPSSVFNIDTNTIILLGIILIIVLILLIVIAVMLKKAKQRKLDRIAAAEKAALMADQMAKRKTDDEKALSLSLLQDENNKVKDTIDGIKEFAVQNPQIAASLIKEWLRDGE